jgi:hypothetical protein
MYDVAMLMHDEMMIKCWSASALAHFVSLESSLAGQHSNHRSNKGDKTTTSNFARRTWANGEEEATPAVLVAPLALASERICASLFVKKATFTVPGRQTVSFPLLPAPAPPTVCCTAVVVAAFGKVPLWVLSKAI